MAKLRIYWVVLGLGNLPVYC